MSAPGASPSGFSNGATPTGATPNGITPNGTASKSFRRPMKSDPLRPRNKKPVRKTLQELGIPPGGAKSAQPVPAKNSAVGGMGRVVPPPQPAPSMANGGWTNPPKGSYQDYQLVTTVRQMKEDLKYHILRFSSKKEVNPTDPNDFTRPISLHRRNPQQQASGKFKDEDTIMGDAGDKDREKYEIQKQEKEEKRAAELAQIAPSLSKATKKNNSYKLEKTTQVRHMNMTEQDQKEAKNRYEEALPWHLEDAENSQTWMGIYEAALSETHVVLVHKKGKFFMIPVDKWYKFMSKNHFKTMTTEEAEAAMNKKVKEPRWVMEQNAAFKEAREKFGASRARASGLFKVKGESESFKNANRGEQNDMDDLDYEEMDFADDEEHVTVEKEQDEDTKDAEERVKRDRLNANLFGEADELAADKEAEAEERKAEQTKLLGRELQKALVKREKNYIYDSDSQDFESSDDEDEEKRKLKEEARKKEEEAKLKAKAESKAAPGTSTKGSNTPLGRPPKNLEVKKTSLKRAGSPNLSASEASGNEAGRKKIKSNPTLSQPIPQQGKSSVKLNANSDKISKITSGAPRPAKDADGDAEMSDGPKKIKLRVPSNTNGASPSSSHAGSSFVTSRRGGSRAGSPQAGTANKAPKPPSDKPLDFTAADIHASLPVEGTTVAELLLKFNVKSYAPNAQREFIDLVKKVAIMDKQARKLKANPLFKATS